MGPQVGRKPGRMWTGRAGAGADIRRSPWRGAGDRLAPTRRSGRAARSRRIRPRLGRLAQRSATSVRDGLRRQGAGGGPAAFPGAGSAAVVSLGAPVHDGQCHPEPLIGVPLAMLNRHGWSRARPERERRRRFSYRRGAVRGRGPGVRRRHQGRRGGPRGAGRARTAGRGARRGDRRRLAPGRVPDRAPELERQAGRAAARDGVVVRAARARQGDGPQRHAGERAVAGVQVLRRPPPAAARLQGPARGAQPPRRRRAPPSCSATTAASRRRRWACCCAR